MSNLITMAGLGIARAVHAVMLEIAVDDGDNSYILTYGFCNNKCTGYHYSANGRGVTVINNPITDEIRLVYGDRKHFNADTNVCDDSTEYLDLHPDNHIQAAQMTMTYLLSGQKPSLF